MKYLLVGLLLLLVPWATLPAAPRPLRNLHLDAWFQVTGAGGRGTEADVFVSVHQGHAEVRLALDRTDPTRPGGAAACPAGAMSVNTVAPVMPGDLVVAPDLTWATLHTSVPAYDACSRSTHNVRIDLAWSATGVAYPVAGVERSAVYDATARGDIASATTAVLTGSRSERGSIGQY